MPTTPPFFASPAVAEADATALRLVLASSSHVGARAVVFSLVFAAILGVLIPVIDFKFDDTYLGLQHFAPGAIGILLVLVLFLGWNPLFRAVYRRFCLSRDEMLVVYLSRLFSALVSGTCARLFESNF